MSQLASMASAFARMPASARAGACMLTYTMLASVANGLIRYLGRDYSALQITFFMHVFVLLTIAPVALSHGLGGFHTRRFGLYAARGLITVFHTACFTYALTLLPVDKATALNFSVPIWTTIGAALILGERVGPRRWSAVVFGVVGSLIIVRPGIEAYEPGSVLSLLAAGGYAVSLLMVKSLSRTEPAWRIVFYLAILTMPMSLAPALLVWRPPSPEFIALTFLLGVMVTGGNLLVVRAFTLADVSLVASIDFFRLPFGAIVGLVAFGEIMDAWGWLGAVVIFGSGAYIAHREARAARRPGPAGETRSSAIRQG